VGPEPLGARYQDEGIVRGDTAALMLSEIRLKSGFVNVAVPCCTPAACRISRP